MRVLSLAAVAAVAITLGCEPNPVEPGSESMPNAYAERSCGAADGPAVNIVLWSKEFASLGAATPNVWIWIEESVMDLAGTTWNLPKDASAWYNKSNYAQEPATAGSIVIHSVGADTSIAGSATMVFGDRRVESEFTATWRSNKILCGLH
jgi:hypothetical protein